MKTDPHRSLQLQIILRLLEIEMRAFKFVIPCIQLRNKLKDSKFFPLINIIFNTYSEFHAYFVPVDIKPSLPRFLLASN
jgi:hypothetical protein